MRSRFVVRERMARVPEREKTCSRGCSVTMSVNRAIARFVGANVASLQTSSARSRYLPTTTHVRTLFVARCSPRPPIAPLSQCPQTCRFYSARFVPLPHPHSSSRRYSPDPLPVPSNPHPHVVFCLHTLLPFAAAIAGEGLLSLAAHPWPPPPIARDAA